MCFLLLNTSIYHVRTPQVIGTRCFFVGKVKCHVGPYIENLHPKCCPWHRKKYRSWHHLVLIWTEAHGEEFWQESKIQKIRASHVDKRLIRKNLRYLRELQHIWLINMADWVIQSNMTGKSYVIYFIGNVRDSSDNMA